jgi:hypothetical protein
MLRQGICALQTQTFFGDRSFGVAAPSLWNFLPVAIKKSSSVPAFKKSLKTHLFQQAFPN